MTGVILAAGASRRMGRPKALLEIDGNTLVRAHVEALAGVCDVVIVVVNGTVQVDVPAHVHVVVNADGNAQMIDSLRLALAGCDAERVVVTPVDVPPVSRDTLARLLEAGPPAVPIDANGERGHPVLIGRPAMDAIRAGSVEGGLRTLLLDATLVKVEDPDVARDFDDPESWASYLGRRRSS